MAPFLLLILGQWRITPHFLQPVKLPGFGLHHMHDHIHVIYQNPLSRVLSLMPVRIFLQFQLHFMLYSIGYRLYLGSSTSLADNEKMGHGFVYFREIKRDYILSFFVLDRLYNGFEDLRILG